MKNRLKEYFYYSRLERNGILVLSFLCVAFFLFPKIYQPSAPESPIDFNPFKEEIAAFEKSFTEEKTKKVKTEALFLFNPNTISEADLNKLGLSSKVIKTFLNYRSKGGKFFNKKDLKKIYGLTEEDYSRLEDFIQIDWPQNTYQKRPKDVKAIATPKAIELFEFDPNSVSKEDLGKLGFSEKAANNLIKFRDKGGVLHQKEELSKIYGLSENLFEKISPYIKIEEKQQPKSLVKKYQAKAIEAKTDFQLEINTASQEDWQKLYGIGPYYAKRIITDREKLGGFYNIDQVGETYNLPDSTFQKIRPQLVLNTPPRQLNLNTITVEKLAAHPYIQYKQAKIIINYRNQHGAFTALSELEKIIALKPALINKIKPYLTLNH